ncbi:hypothetical protein KDA_22450 [Dictyobacter alpinus]|uniref:ABC transporter domain-containing protein n=1 Tax=Dictyobacter alpinus TaxID=2014873 RepID=A0A402B5X6_9CHLR|nr:ABC transporter ATP-binding protein [Dictyobacter alpinus]GCE26761.1 hypothetical protein KDA_22450 [Dictyobacter alpinus]
MDELPRNFPYTARRTTYLTIVCSFGFLLLMESGGVALVANLLITNPWLRISINLVHLGLCIFIAIAMVSVLSTRHRITPGGLQLNYGRTLHVQLPYVAIRDVQPVRDVQAGLQPLTARYDSKKQELVACFSDQGQLLLRLHTAQLLKIGHKEHLVSSILFNVDQPELFLTTLTPYLQDLMEAVAEIMPPHTRRSEDALVRSVQAQSQSGQLVIVIENLTRRFADFVAVDKLNMTIGRGEIYGFLGSNGAGKTTTIKMLVGLLEPHDGYIRLAGHDVWSESVAAKRLLGYVADRALLYDRLTGREFLAFLAQVRGLAKNVADQKIEQLLAVLDLTEYAQRLCGSYSFGMKRKLALAGALLHEPAILILDEPFNGLDPRSARHLKDLLLVLARQGTTILLSTHDLATAEAICDRVGIFHKGRLMAEGSAVELRQLAEAPDLETVFLQLTSEQKEEVGV